MGPTSGHSASSEVREGEYSSTCFWIDDARTGRGAMRARTEAHRLAQQALLNILAFHVCSSGSRQWAHPIRSRDVVMTVAQQTKRTEERRIKSKRYMYTAKQRII